VRLNRTQYDNNVDRLRSHHESVVFIADDRLRPGDVELEMGATRITEILEEKLNAIATELLSSLTDEVPTSAHNSMPVEITP
jgi:hypothetical protein